MILSRRVHAVAGPVAFTLLSVWLGNAALPAQETPTIGEVARREQERRRTITIPARIYTNKDLPKPAVVAAPRVPTPPPTVHKPETSRWTVDDQEPKEAGEEARWRKRITAARDELQRNELAADAFQSRINALTTDFVNRDDPFQRAQIAADRQKALDELGRVKAEVLRLKLLIAEVEEEARVAGVPPGWLR